MARKKILIIDDENDLVELLKFNLEQQGYQVIAVKEAEEGLEIVCKQKPDLVLLDLMLPNMDGFEFCRILRQETDTPVVFLTASKSEVCKKLAMTLGATDYLAKPFSIDALLNRIHSIVN